MSNGTPPPVNLQPPPIQTYASDFPGSPEEQAYLRGQHNAKQQTALNFKHAGGTRRRRRRRRRRRSRRSRRKTLRGGATNPDAPGWVDPDNPTWRDPDDPNPSWIPIPQSQTGVHETGPATANTASFNGNKALLGGRAAAQYDSQVQFTPTMGQSQVSRGGRRRRRRKRRKTKRHRVKRRTHRRRRRTKRGGLRRRHRRKTRRRKKRHRRRRRSKGGGCTTCSLR